MNYEDFLKKEEKRKEKEATSPKNLKDGLSRRERIDIRRRKRGFNGI